jgi:hypothetical protein
MASDTPPPHQVRQDHRPPAARVQAALEQPVGRARHGPCQIRKRHGPCKQLQPALCVLPVPREGGHSPPSSRSDGDRAMRLLPLRQRRAALCHAAAMTHGNDPRRGRQTTRTIIQDHSRRTGVQLRHGSRPRLTSSPDVCISYSRLLQGNERQRLVRSDPLFIR